MKITLWLLALSGYVIHTGATFEEILVHRGIIGGIFRGPNSETIIQGPDGGAITAEQIGGALLQQPDLQPIALANSDLNDITVSSTAAPDIVVSSTYAPVPPIIRPAGVRTSTLPPPNGLQPIAVSSRPTASLGYAVSSVAPPIESTVVSSQPVLIKSDSSLVGGSTATTFSEPAKVLLPPTAIPVAASNIPNLNRGLYPSQPIPSTTQQIYISDVVPSAEAPTTLPPITASSTARPLDRVDLTSPRTPAPIISIPSRFSPRVLVASDGGQAFPVRYPSSLTQPQSIQAVGTAFRSEQDLPRHNLVSSTPVPRTWASTDRTVLRIPNGYTSTDRPIVLTSTIQPPAGSKWVSTDLVEQNQGSQFNPEQQRVAPIQPIPQQTIPYNLFAPQQRVVSPQSSNIQLISQQNRDLNSRYSSAPSPIANPGTGHIPSRNEIAIPRAPGIVSTSTKPNIKSSEIGREQQANSRADQHGTSRQILLPPVPEGAIDLGATISTQTTTSNGANGTNRQSQYEVYQVQPEDVPLLTNTNPIVTEQNQNVSLGGVSQNAMPVPLGDGAVLAPQDFDDSFSAILWNRYERDTKSK